MQRERDGERRGEKGGEENRLCIQVDEITVIVDNRH